MTIDCATISSGAGLVATVSSLGAALHRLEVPTRSGPINVVLGYERPQDYLRDEFYVGALIGRYAGRIDSGRFELDGVAHRLSTRGDASGHCLHGGADGFHRRTWSLDADSDACELVYVSRDGEQGFPGELEARVRYQVSGQRLIVTFQASCQRATIVNLTQHAYFNLSGEDTVMDHRVRIDAPHYLPLGKNLIPLGRLASVEGSPFDLRGESALADRCAAGIDSFDHYYVRRDRGIDQAVASVYAPASRLRMNVYTTQPGLQFYTGHYLDTPFQPQQGLCLEAQGFPDAPNQASFSDQTLRPGDLYEHTTIYEFVAAESRASD